MQSPMISAPLKQTNEIDWIQPLKQHIRQSYGDDPERYNEECATLDRLRQDMRGAGKDSASGRDLLYRYYGQFELLDLRFPVDENHIKVSFTWFDAFTHKPTSQYSLAFEKASIIFNISAVLSCHGANQDRYDETGLKTAYHSFQASAGMFTYINENFLHAPSTDLSRDTVKTMISLMLAQAQEVFLEKQIADGKKAGLLAKLAAQATFLYNSAAEGVQENVAKGVFERVWFLLAQVKQYYMAAIAQYYQALADDDANSHGIAICRLQTGLAQAKEAQRFANSFPTSVSQDSNLSNETASILVEMTKKHVIAIQEKLAELNKDNDFIYHQLIPAEASLTAIPKLPAAKAIPVSELYQGQDIQRIIGPDIFQRIVPMSVTESASLYDEEKAKLVRAEGERVETANDELAASLDYLKLPGSLNILKGGLDQQNGVDPEFTRWCSDFVGHTGFTEALQSVSTLRAAVVKSLDDSSRRLDMEESVCEKMRSKYGADWTQQPSSVLTTTLRGDIRSYRSAILEASNSDSQLSSMYHQHEAEMNEMRSAGEVDEADVLYQQAMMKTGSGRTASRDSAAPNLLEENLLDDFDDEGRQTVTEQIGYVEELIRKLNLVKRERQQVLKDLKDKVHSDDISNVLILNKKAVTAQDNQIFKTELEKFRPYQSRILQSNHKQNSLVKELTRTYSELLSDKRVKTEQNKYEVFSRQRNTVLKKYRAVHQAFMDLQSGLDKAKTFYSEMEDTVASLDKNVEAFVNNRRSEGSQLLTTIESRKGPQDRDRDRLNDMMQKMSVGGHQQSSSSTPQPGQSAQTPSSYPQQSMYSAPQGYQQAYQSGRPSDGYAGPSAFSTDHNGGTMNGQYQQGRRPGASTPSRHPYNPSVYPQMSPPAHQQLFSPQSTGYQMQSQMSGVQTQPPYPQAQQGYMPPPPPPPGRPIQQQQQQQQQQQHYSSPQPGSGVYSPPPSQRQQSGPTGGDPWAGLHSWK